MRSPFPGLEPFGLDDAELFAGRSEERKVVIANLRAAPLTILYGPSGVGKSSLLLAGVVPALRELEEAARSAGNPAPSVIIQRDWAGDPAGALVDAIHEGAGGTLEDAIERWSRDHSGTLLVILDQFEEYLRLHPLSGEDPFDRVFPEVAGRLDLRVHFLVAVREDTLAQLDRFEGRIPHLFDNYLRLPPLTGEAARRAIEEPVRTVGDWRQKAGLPRIELEDGLVDDVLSQLTDPRQWAAEGFQAGTHASVSGPGGRGSIEPAFLQLVMNRLWDVDSGAGSSTLRRRTLQRLGGAPTIVRSHLDTAMARLSPRQQGTAAALFGFLVTPSGAKIRYTAPDLADYAARPEPEVASVLEALSQPDLRVLRRVPAPSGDPDERGYEIFHDVLAGAVRDWRVRRVRRLETRMAWLALALAAVVAMAISLIVYSLDTGPFHRLDLRTIDARFALRGDRTPDPRILLVDGDDRTFTRDGTKGILSRVDQARVLDAVLAGPAAAVVDDFEFRDGKRGDAALKAAVQRGGRRVILAASLIDDAGRTLLFGSTNPPGNLQAHAGYAGLPNDPGPVLRRVRYEGRQPGGSAGLPSMAVRAAAVAGVEVPAGAFPSRGALIDYRGGPGTYPRVPWDAVLRGRIPARTFRGRVVVIGAMARVKGDLHRTSALGGRTMYGPEIQANAIDTVLHRLPLKDAPRGVVVVLIVLFALVPPFLALRCRTWLTLALSGGLGAVFLVAAQIAFDNGVVVPVAYPLLALVLAAAAIPIVARLRPDPLSSDRGGRASRAARSPRT